MERKLFPVGPAYLAHVRRKVHDLTFEVHDSHEEERNRLAGGSSPDEIIDDLGVGDEEEDEDLLSLDPKEWKVRSSQPFNRTWVLILEKKETRPLRGPRTLSPPVQSHQRPDQNRSCVTNLVDLLGFFRLLTVPLPHRNTYVADIPFHTDRKKVLKHHPDKKATIAGETNDDAFFKCIQKAMDVLTNPERRRQFDSVDPHYLSLEEDVPTAAQLKDKDHTAFFKAFTPVFEREARYSKEQPVPPLGTYDAPKEEVEGFYDFWYNFDSWRSFEYLDKEINEGSDKCGSIHCFQAS